MHEAIKYPLQGRRMAEGPQIKSPEGYNTREASLEQVSSPGGVYIFLSSFREIACSTLGAFGAQVVYPSSRGEAKLAQ